MAPVTMPPSEEARELFRELGYDVSGDGTEFIAERKWRTVHVTALSAEADSPRAVTDGGAEPRLRCFVTWKGYTGDLRETLEGLKPAYDWAVVGIDEGGDHSVVHGRV